MPGKAKGIMKQPFGVKDWEMMDSYLPFQTEIAYDVSIRLLSEAQQQELQRQRQSAFKAKPSSPTAARTSSAKSGHKNPSKIQNSDLVGPKLKESGEKASSPMSALIRGMPVIKGPQVARRRVGQTPVAGVVDEVLDRLPPPQVVLRHDLTVTQLQSKLSHAIALDEYLKIRGVALDTNKDGEVKETDCLGLAANPNSTQMSVSETLHQSNTNSLAGSKVQSAASGVIKGSNHRPFWVHTRRNRYTCMCCGVHGGLVQLIMAMDGCDILGVVEQLVMLSNDSNIEERIRVKLQQTLATVIEPAVHEKEPSVAEDTMGIEIQPTDDERLEALYQSETRGDDLPDEDTMYHLSSVASDDTGSYIEIVSRIAIHKRRVDADGLMSIAYLQLQADAVDGLVAALDPDALAPIKQLDLTGNNIGNDGVRKLVQALEHNRSCENLSVAVNQISSGALPDIARMIDPDYSLDVDEDCLCPPLQELQLRSNRLGSNTALCKSGFELVANALRSNESLRVLDLSCNSITGICAAPLFDSLTHNRTLQHLDLSWNQLGPGIAESIKAGLSSNNSLFTLRLGWCALGDEGVSSVCVGAQHGGSLSMLDLSCNRAGPASGSALSSVVGKLQSLRVLKLRCNPLGQETVSSIIQTAQGVTSHAVTVALEGSEGLHLSVPSVKDEVQQGFQIQSSDGTYYNQDTHLRRKLRPSSGTLKPLLSASALAGILEDIDSPLTRPHARVHIAGTTCSMYRLSCWQLRKVLERMVDKKDRIYLTLLAFPRLTDLSKFRDSVLKLHEAFGESDELLQDLNLKRTLESLGIEPPSKHIPHENEEAVPLWPAKVDSYLKASLPDDATTDPNDDSEHISRPGNSKGNVLLASVLEEDEDDNLNSPVAPADDFLPVN